MLVLGEIVGCRRVDTDQYGRMVARCFSDGLDLGYEMVWAGWALAFPLAGDNDGVVHPDSARWGDFHGVLPSDHVGLLGHGPSGFDHLGFYERLAQDLIARGF